MGAMHRCPGDCGTEVTRALLACRACWYRLPRELQGALRQACARGAHTAEHRAALRDALDWYRANPSPNRSMDTDVGRGITS